MLFVGCIGFLSIAVFSAHWQNAGKVALHVKAIHDCYCGNVKPNHRAQFAECGEERGFEWAWPVLP
jgi:hypothetical protein